ncbi:unnamed protein product, partial [Pocillopora meandrina]
MTSAPNEPLNQLHIDNTQDLSSKDFADLINNSLIAPMRAYNPLDTSNISTLLDEIHEYPNLNTNLADTDLLCVKEAKKPQPDPERIRTSYHAPTQRLVERTEATPRMETSQHNTSSQGENHKHLRPISLAPALSKLAEDFLVEKPIAPAVLKIIDPSQFG